MPKLMQRGWDGADLIIVQGSQQCFDEVTAAADPKHAFLRMAWYAAEAGEALEAIAIRRPDGSPVAALPRVRRGHGSISLAAVPGCYWPFRSFPIAEDVSHTELVALLKRSEIRSFLGPAWRIGPVFSGDSSAARLGDAAAAAGWTMLTRPLGTCFEIDFAALRDQGPWPRKSSRASNRRRERQISEIGALEYRFLSGRDWTSQDRDAVATIESQSWLATIGKAADTKFHDPARRRIWERAAEDPKLASMIFCSLLLVGGDPAAFAFGIEAGGVRHCIANNFSQRFAQYSPGKLLLYKDFERAADRGVKRINWGSGDVGYKSEIGAEPGQEIFDLLFVRPTILAVPLRKWWTGRLATCVQDETRLL